ncbi:hypothetical protein CEXT_779861 [Caerostris extrusa]|uniref:Uncharacterized protein n=1 Tax=Caerostris extrusa TaxID=172846 RepID=A0AAV4UM94_CAEEX|nr:hypothetical protein CEXT_779861 [Caerostris extrusa]
MRRIQRVGTRKVMAQERCKYFPFRFIYHESQTAATIHLTWTRRIREQKHFATIVFFWESLVAAGQISADRKQPREEELNIDSSVTLQHLQLFGLERVQTHLGVERTGEYLFPLSSRTVSF